MRTAFSQLSVLLIICCVIVSAHKSHKHDKKERDIREFKKVIERRDDDPGSCCCKNASRKWKSQDYEDKMGRYLYETIVDEDYKHKSSKRSKREAKAGKNSDQIVTDKHASKKSYKKVKDIDDEATSVYTADTEIHSDSKDRKSYSSDAKNSSISEAMICLQKCVETLTNWKLF